MKKKKSRYSFSEVERLIYSEKYSCLLERMREDFIAAGITPETVDAEIIATLDYACRESIFVRGWAKSVRGVMSLLDSAYKRK